MATLRSGVVFIMRPSESNDWIIHTEKAAILEEEVKGAIGIEEGIYTNIDIAKSEHTIKALSTKTPHIDREVFALPRNSQASRKKPRCISNLLGSGKPFQVPYFQTFSLQRLHQCLLLEQAIKAQKM